VRIEDLKAELGRKVLRPAYVVLGPEAHLRRNAIELVREAAVAPDAAAFNLTEFDGEAALMADVVAAANTFPMLAPRRMVIVRDARPLDAAEAEVLGAYLRAPQARTVLVLAAADLDRRTTFFKLLAQHCAVVEAEKLKGAAVQRWAAERIRAQGGRISPGALRRLVDLTGADLDVLASEIDKLLLYSEGDGRIPDAAVDELVQNSRQVGIFELTDAIGRGDRPQALRVLGGLFDAGEAAGRILGMLARHFRQVLIVKDLASRGKSPAEIASAAQIPGFLREEFLGQARNLDLAVVQAMYLRLAEADRRFKSSATDQRMLLEKLIAAL
jgi:DNA polymerase-3 subunit delta